MKVIRMAIVLRPGFFSLVFFVLEFIFLTIMIIKNRDHPFAKSLFMIMGLLQLYQLTEFLLCIGVDDNIVGRLAITTITFLPPTGYYLSAKLSGWKLKDYWIWFIFAAGLSGYYIFLPQSVQLVDCNPFYAIYNIPLGFFYGLQYFGIILLSLLLITLQAIRRKLKTVNRWAIYLLVGYIVFLAPMALTVLIENSFMNAVPSILCKYAILLAITLFIFSFVKKNHTEKL